MKKEDLTARVADKFEKIIYATDSCIEWKETINRNGYPSQCFSKKGKNFMVHAHKVSFLIFNGNIEDGLFVLHSCDNKKCINPKHLFLGTHQDNMKDMLEKGRGSKLSYEDILEIRKLNSEGVSRKDLAIKYQVGNTAIQKIISCTRRVNA